MSAEAEQVQGAAAPAPAVDTTRRIVLRGALLVALVTTLLTLFSLPDWARRAEVEKFAAVVTLGVGVMITGALERRAALRGWSPRRASDAVVLVATVCAIVAGVQSTYAGGAMTGGPHAGLAAVVAEWSRPEVLVGGTIFAAFGWGLPCGLMTLQRLDPGGARSVWPLALAGTVLTCGTVVVVLLPLWLSDKLAGLIDSRLG